MFTSPFFCRRLFKSYKMLLRPLATAFRSITCTTLRASLPYRPPTKVFQSNIQLTFGKTSRTFTTGECRCSNSGFNKSQPNQKGKSTVYYVTALGVLVVGLSYAAVPLYRLFCQSYSYGGTTSAGHNSEGLESLKPNHQRILKIRFNADTSSNLMWKFRPQQTELKVALGETALAFYTATNSTDRPIDGISTYNVVPFEAGQYFNKIQCFCFEEQRLNPHEQVDMPVFFYIDPEFGEDPRMENVETITLSYTFFEAKEGAHFVKPDAHPVK